MSRPAPRRDAAWRSRLALVLAVVIVVLAGVTLVLNTGSGLPIGRIAGGLITSVLLAGFGGLLANRRPRNPAGWLLLAAGGGQVLSAVLAAYGVYGVHTHPGALPFALAVWTVGGAGWWTLMFFSVPLLLMVFPNGRLPSRRWRPVAIGLLFAAAVSVVGQAFGPDTIGGDLDSPPNPLAHLLPGAGPIAAAAFIWLLAATVAAIVSLVRRLRRATGVERAQYQWFTYGTGTFAVVLAAAFIPGASEHIVLLGLVAFLASLSVAMLRYRLYEIGRVVSRTISYAVLTALLAACYVALVTLITAVLPSTGSLAVAVATLAAAAAFNPLRRRVQVVVDRRFNRQRYDAARTAERFAQHLRSEVDLDALVAELRAVVQQTLEPADVRIWVREGT